MSGGDALLSEEDEDHTGTRPSYPRIELIQSPRLIRIPNEILVLITDNLDQPDIKSLLLTCVRFAVALPQILLRRDIRDGVYNSLAWACMYGDLDLAKIAIEGESANTNAGFCRGKPHDQEFVYPVFPTKKVRRVNILRDVKPCSALVLATQNDHVALIKYLLDKGAQVKELRGERMIQHHGGIYPWAPKFSHMVAVSHVRSISAAEALLKSGTGEFINDTANTLHTPLEMILYRCRQANRKPALREAELHQLVGFLLNQGALSRTRAPVAHQHVGVLRAAVSTQYTSVVKLIAAHGITTSAVNNTIDEECEREIFNAVERADQKRFNLHLLCSLLDAGASPNIRFDGETLLKTAIRCHNYEAAHILLSRGADVEFHTNHRPTSILYSLISDCQLGRNERQKKAKPMYGLVSHFISSGADWKGHRDPLPPVMLALSDHVEDYVFEEMLHGGIMRNGLWKPFANDILSAVMPCLVSGMKGFPTFGQDRLSFTRIKERRTAKFRAFTRPGVKEAAFWMSDGRHVLTWALETLYGYDIRMSVDLLSSWYIQTKSKGLPNDSEPPLFALFGKIRREVFLKISTLQETFNIVSDLLAAGFTADEQYLGATVLHHICKLEVKVPTEDDWNDVQIPSNGGNKMTGHLRNEIKLINPDFRGRQFDPLTYDLLKKDVYLAARSANMRKILVLFLRRGVSLYKKDDAGKTAYEYARENRILDCIPAKWRDASKEHELF